MRVRSVCAFTTSHAKQACRRRTAAPCRIITSNVLPVTAQTNRYGIIIVGSYLYMGISSIGQLQNSCITRATTRNCNTRIISNITTQGIIIGVKTIVLCMRIIKTTSVIPKTYEPRCSCRARGALNKVTC